MGFLSLVSLIFPHLRLLRIFLTLKGLKQSKDNLIRQQRGLPPRYSYYSLIVSSLFEPFKNLYTILFAQWFHWDVQHKNNYMQRLYDGKTIENQMLKSTIGFLCGLLLSWIIFFFLEFQLNVTRSNCIMISVCFTFVLTLGFAFSNTCRCVFILSLPTIFVSRGRYLMVAYILLLLYTKPILNTFKNGNILIESFVCGYGVARESTQSGFSNLEDRIDDQISNMMRPFEEAFIAIRDKINVLKDSLDSIGEFLSPIKKIFTDINYDFNCNFRLINCKKVTDVVKATFLEKICEINNFPNLVKRELCISIINTTKELGQKIKNEISNKVKEITDELYFNMTLNHEFVYTRNISKSVSSMAKEMMNDFAEKFKYLTIISDLILFDKFLLIVYFSWVIIIAIIYRTRFNSSNAFDNLYINKEFFEINKKRELAGRESLIPLKFNERRKYIDPWDLKMTSTEKRKLYLGFAIFTFTFVQVIMYLGMDVGLWWIMTLIRQLLETLSTIRLPPMFSLKVKGSGLLAKTYREMASAAKPITEVNRKLNDCKPDPNTPDWETYTVIGSLLSIIFLSLFIEAYGLRSRHYVAGLFFPNRVKERASWLYSQILCQRGDFFSFVRRKLTRENDKMERVSLLDYLCAKYFWVRIIMKTLGVHDNYKNCLLCGRRGGIDDIKNFKHCTNATCNGIYCNNCFLDINNQCALCMTEHMDSEDSDEEYDSSDDEEYESRPKVTTEDFEYQYYSSEEETDDKHNK